MVKHPDRIEMIENEIAKLEKPDHVRRSSCLYPRVANRASSSVGGGLDGSSFLIICHSETWFLVLRARGLGFGIRRVWQPNVNNYLPEFIFIRLCNLPSTKPQALSTKPQ